MQPDNPQVIPLSSFLGSEVYLTYFTFNVSIEKIVSYQVIILLISLKGILDYLLTCYLN